MFTLMIKVAVTALNSPVWRNFDHGREHLLLRSSATTPRADCAVVIR
jgi:hypothetical protein